MIRHLLAAMALLAGLIALPAHAHQLKAAESTITVNERTGRMEIMHRIPLHDAEHALRDHGMQGADIIGDDESQKAFAAYLAERFTLLVDGEKVSLNFIGSEIDGGSLWIYEDADVPAEDAALLVNSQILTDIWASQTNRVNFTRGTVSNTLVFQQGDGLSPATFP